jgi:deoxyribose-phosphate aldolase
MEIKMKTELTPARLAKYLDQTLLKAYPSRDDFRVFCEQSARYNFKSIAVNSAMVAACREYLGDSDVLVCATTGFPLGQTTIDVKLYETKKAIEDGADEIDYVQNIVELKSGNLEYVEREMRQIVEICRAHGRTTKVIFENCYLTDDQKKALCEIALKVRPDFIKTSTGFGAPPPGTAVGATLADVRLMKSMVGDEIKVKASGGIRTLDDALAMIEAGADRIGTSAGVSIIEELKALK